MKQRRSSRSRSGGRRVSRDSRSRSRDRSPSKRSKNDRRSRSPKRPLKSAMKKTRTPSPPKMRMNQSPPKRSDSRRDSRRSRSPAPKNAGWGGRKASPPRGRGGRDRSPPRKNEGFGGSGAFGKLGGPPGALGNLTKDTGFRYRGPRVSPPKMKGGGGKGGFGGGRGKGGKGGGKPPPPAMAGGFTKIKTFAELIGGGGGGGSSNRRSRSPPRRNRSPPRRSPPRRDRKRSASPPRRSPPKRRMSPPQRSRDSPRRVSRDSPRRDRKPSRDSPVKNSRESKAKSKSSFKEEERSSKRRSASPRDSVSPPKGRKSKYDDTNFKVSINAEGDRSTKRESEKVADRMRRSLSLGEQSERSRSRSDSRDRDYNRKTNGTTTSTPQKQQQEKAHQHADDPNDARSILARRRERFGVVEDTSKSQGSDDDYNDPDRKRGTGKFLKKHVNQRRIAGRPFPLVHQGRNTESFEPDYDPCDMRVNVASHRVETEKYPNPIHENDVFLVPDLYHEYGPGEIYTKLLAELDDIQQLPKYKNSQIWTPWHGDNHLIADDKCGWTRDAPFFRSLMDRLREYFDMDIRATRFNWYKDDTDWKPYHFDAAAVKPDKARTQNTTIGVSFGAQRDIAFEHHKTRTRIAFPLPDGSAFGFGRLVNYDFRHAVPAIHPDKQTGKNGRISIIAWGVARQEEPV